MRLLERRPRAVRGERTRRADPGDDVLALGVGEELAVELLLAVGRVAREGDARRRGLAPVSEDHRLHVDGRPPVVRDVVELAVGLGALVLPGAEHRADRSPELLARVVRKGVAGSLAGRSPRTRRTISRQVRGRQLRVGLDAPLRACLVRTFSNSCRGTRRTTSPYISRNRRRQSRAKRSPAEAGEPASVRGREPEVQDRVHHARHGGAGAGADRDEERVLRVAEAACRWRARAGAARTRPLPARRRGSPRARSRRRRRCRS